MDNLARDVMLAKQAGMSYGQWKAMQPQQQAKQKALPEGHKKCIGCGKVFYTADKRQIYCDAVCRIQANQYKNRERARMRYAEKRASENLPTMPMRYVI